MDFLKGLLIPCVVTAVKMKKRVNFMPQDTLCSQQDHSLYQRELAGDLVPLIYFFCWSVQAWAQWGLSPDGPGVDPAFLCPAFNWISCSIKVISSLLCSLGSFLWVTEPERIIWQFHTSFYSIPSCQNQNQAQGARTELQQVQTLGGHPRSLRLNWRLGGWCFTWISCSKSP